MLVEGERASGMVAARMCLVGGIRTSGTLGGDEAIAALQFSAPAM